MANEFIEGSATQAAFFYQNHVAAAKVLDLLDFGTPVRSVVLDNYDRGKHIDDVIVDYEGFTRYYQVKWSAGDDSPYTLHNLLTPPKDKKKSLIRELAEGYLSLLDRESAEIILFSTKKASTAKQPAKDLDCSLAEFIERIHQPFVEDKTLSQLSDLPRYEDFKEIITKLIAASGLDESSFSHFLKRLRFQLDQPGIQSQKRELIYRYERLGIDQTLYDSLLTAIVEWSVSGKSITSSDVLRRLGLEDRFIDNVVQDFPVDENHFVKSTRLFHRIDESIKNLPGGFILLEGPPGSGKSTYLTAYQKTHSAVRFCYYCFVPNEIALGNLRLEKDTFLKSICVGIQNSFPEVDFPRRYSVDFERKLQSWLEVLGRLDRKVVFVIDGIDHVDKKKDVLTQPLTNYLDGDLPENVFFLLSSQYPEALAPSIQQRIRTEPLRHIKMERFTEGEIQLFLERRDVAVSNDALPLVVDRSEGIPLYLYYIARLLHGVPSYQQYSVLEKLPNLENSEIDTYHSYLYDHLSTDHLAIWILSLLAHRKDFTDTSTLQALLNLVRSTSNSHEIEAAIGRIDHLLKISDAKSYAIFHNSFREFLLKKSVHLTDEINNALISYYQNNPTGDETYRNYYRHLFELGRYEDVLRACDEIWLNGSWHAFRPFDEISGNIDIAWDSASRLESLREFIRIAFLEQQLGTIRSNVDLAEFDYSTFLLNIQRPAEALRRIWDGSKILVSADGFYRFVKRYFEVTGNRLPKRIADVGFSQFDREASQGEVSERFRARALYETWRDLFDDVNSYHWQTTDEHTDVTTRVGDEENDRINNSIKKAMIDTFSLTGEFGVLVEISEHSDTAMDVRQYAKFHSIKIAIRANERQEAIRLSRLIDFSSLDRTMFNRLLITLAEKQCLHDVTGSIPINYIPPSLFVSLTKKEAYKGLKEELIELYDNLRIHFLQNPNGYSLYSLRASTMNLPEKGFFNAIIDLAKLWVETVKSGVSESQKTERIKQIFRHLNIDSTLRSDAFREHVDDSYFIGRDAYKIYSHILEYTSLHVSSPFVETLVSYWLALDEGPSGYKDLRINLEFATRMGARNEASLGPSILKLLERAEAYARADEETSSLVSYLLQCAEAYGQCGFMQHAVRLWDELFTLGCGIQSRKDYQFSEAIEALHRVHQIQPDKSAARLTNLLTLAHQLEGVADGRAVAWAIEELIAFSSELSPSLALELLRTEDQWIFRERAIDRLSRALINAGTDIRYVWAVVRTMDKWANYSAYKEETFPAMLHVFESCLEAKNLTLAEEIYIYARHQLIVEKGMPGRLFQLAEKCVNRCIVFATVSEDYAMFKSDREKDLETDKQPDNSLLSHDVPGFEELHAVSEDDFEGFLNNIHKVASQFIEIDISKELKQAYEHFKEATVSYYQSLDTNTKKQIEVKPFSLIRAFVEFKHNVLASSHSAAADYNRCVARAFHRFINAVQFSLFGRSAEHSVKDFFNHPKWLAQFLARTDRPNYWFSRNVVEPNILRLIDESSLSKLSKWEQFCKSWQSGYELTRSLVAITKRIRHVNKDHAIQLLLEALEANDSFFYSDRETLNTFFDLFFQVDKRRARHLLLDTFSNHYKSYPAQIVYYLDRVLKYAKNFDDQNIEEFVYQQYEKYNSKLAEGLVPKPRDYQWIHTFEIDSFERATVGYLVKLFDYPEVEIRRLCLSSLFALYSHNNGLLRQFFELSRNESENVKEHFLSLLFSISLSDPHSVTDLKDGLLEFLNIDHFNIRQLTKEILGYCVDQGVQFKPEEINRIIGTNAKPSIIRPALEEGSLQKGRKFVPCEYQTSLLYNLQRFHSRRDDYLLDKVYTRLINRGWTASWTETEGAVHRRHNINSNFDNIEINGPYFQAVQNVLNEVFAEEIEKGKYDDRAINAIAKHFRLYDPSDLHVKTVSRPPNVTWTDFGLTDEEFLQFNDVAKNFSVFAQREDEWVTLYEDGHERAEDDRKGWTTYFKVIAYLLRSEEVTHLKELMQSEVPAPYLIFENCYRFEVPALFPHSTTFPLLDDGIRPIIGVSDNRFRAQEELSIASLLPDLVEDFRLSREAKYALNFERDGQRQLEFIAWQEPYDQDRRRQKPRSAGVILKISRALLDRYLTDFGFALCYDVMLRRSADKYEPEKKMKWVAFRGAYPR